MIASIGHAEFLFLASPICPEQIIPTVFWFKTSGDSHYTVASCLSLGSFFHIGFPKVSAFADRPLWDSLLYHRWLYTFSFILNVPFCFCLMSTVPQILFILCFCTSTTYLGLVVVVKAFDLPAWWLRTMPPTLLLLALKATVSRPKTSQKSRIIAVFVYRSFWTGIPCWVACFQTTYQYKYFSLLL